MSGCDCKNYNAVVAFYCFTFLVEVPLSFWYLICIHATFRSGALDILIGSMTNFYKSENVQRVKFGNFEYF